MSQSTAPFKCCVPCMHVGAKKVVEGGGMKPICKLRAGSQFESDCAFSPAADRERKANLASMPAWARLEIRAGR